MKEYFEKTCLLGVVGVSLAVVAWGCALSHSSDVQHTLFFETEMPMAVFGIIGYLFIAVTAGMVLVLGSWFFRSVSVYRYRRESSGRAVRGLLHYISDLEGYKCSAGLSWLHIMLDAERSFALQIN